jgi:flagellar basal body rod protein FlgG
MKEDKERLRKMRMIHRFSLILIYYFLSAPLFCNTNEELFFAYNLCITNLKNYNMDSYKTYIIKNGIKQGRSLKMGNYRKTDAYYNFVIDGSGYILVEKSGKYYFTRYCDFFYDYENNNIINKDNYSLVLKCPTVPELTQGDIIKNIILFNIDIEKSITDDNIYFKSEDAEVIDLERLPIFGCLEKSNVFAVSNLLEMKYILFSLNADKYKFIIDNINILLTTIDHDDDNNRDGNWNLINQHLPYLTISEEM